MPLLSQSGTASLNKLLHRPKRADVHFSKAVAHACWGVAALLPLHGFNGLHSSPMGDFSTLAFIVGGHVVLSLTQLLLTVVYPPHTGGVTSSTSTALL